VGLLAGLRVTLEATSAFWGGGAGVAAHRAASCPLRSDALASAPKPGQAHRRIPPNKKTYQQDPANFREALREARLDEAEGADIMMVKPGLPYLDVIRLLRDSSPLPIAAYHVSGGEALL
jgi:delta-aminolevulinic acid dehydratase/porphobilinogen synthase